MTLLPRSNNWTGWLAAGAALAIAVALHASRLDMPRDQVNLIFSTEEAETYRSRVREGSREDFPLSVRFGPQESVSATAHLRGQSSFGCGRKSLTLNLRGKRPRFASFESVTDKFYLLSLCRDRGFVRQHTVLSLWRRLGLFPLRHRFVDLRFNESSHGVYLLVERMDRLRIKKEGFRALLRRRFDYEEGTTFVEVKENLTSDTRARVDYATIRERVRGLSGQALIEGFRTTLNLDQYLLWMASNALLENGDSVDELWIVSEARAPSGGDDRYLSFFAWDPEDIFTPCHLEGRFAFDDTHELTYCAEAEWDRMLLSDPIAYELYVDTLEELVERRLTPEVFDQALVETEIALRDLLERESVAGPMAHVLGPNESAREIEMLRESFTSSRTRIRENIARYRARR